MYLYGTTITETMNYSTHAEAHEHACLECAHPHHRHHLLHLRYCREQVKKGCERRASMRGEEGMKREE